MHQRSCVASNLDDLKALFTQSNATNQQQTNDAYDIPPSPQQEKIPVKDGIKLPSKREEWETANIYFHANLDVHSNITDTENEVCVFQSCVYDYFKVIEKSKDPDDTRNSLCPLILELTEYNHLSQVQLKKNFERA